MKEEILRLLRSADGYISGQELCNRFGVSRTAVWKAINQLKEAGYEIEAQQNKGYRLMAAPDLMTEAEIKSLMHTDWVAKEVLYFDTIDSTNIKAQELAEKGYPSGTLVVADKQESGKGRRSRSWVSPSGTGIFMLDEIVSVFFNVLFTGIGYCFVVEYSSCSSNNLNSFFICIFNSYLGQSFCYCLLSGICNI